MEVGGRLELLEAWAERLGFDAQADVIRIRSRLGEPATARVELDRLEARLAEVQRRHILLDRLDGLRPLASLLEDPAEVAHLDQLRTWALTAPEHQAAFAVHQAENRLDLAAAQVSRYITSLAEEATTLLAVRTEGIQLPAASVRRLQDLAAGITLEPTASRAMARRHALDTAIDYEMSAWRDRIEATTGAEPEEDSLLLAWAERVRARFPFEPLDGRFLSAKDRRWLRASLAALVFMGLLLLRPADWGAIGGIEDLGIGVRKTRIELTAIAVSATIASATIARASLQSTGWRRRLGIVLVGLFVAGIAGVVARATGAGFAGKIEQLNLGELLWAFLLFIIPFSGTFAGLAAIAVGLAPFDVVPRWATRTVVGTVIWAGISPLLAWMLGLWSPMFFATRIDEVVREGGMPALSVSQASGLYSGYLSLLYAAGLVVLWQAIELSKGVIDSARWAGRRFTSWLPVIALLLAGKLTWILLGYRGDLPGWAGGDADVWAFSNTGPTFALAGLAYLPAAFLVLRRCHSDESANEVTRWAIVLIPTVGLAATLQVGLTLLDGINTNLVPKDTSLLDPLFVDLATANRLSLAALAVMVGVWWRSHPARSAVCALSALLVTPSVAQELVHQPLPIVGPSHLDAWVTLCALAIVMWARWTGAVAAARAAVVVVVATTLVAHAGTLMPAFISGRLVTVGLIATFAFALVVDAGPINLSARARPQAALLAVGSMLLMASLTLAGVRFDRPGEDANTFELLREAGGALAQARLVLPLVAVLTVLALRRDLKGEIAPPSGVEVPTG